MVADHRDGEGGRYEGPDEETILALEAGDEVGDRDGDPEVDAILLVLEGRDPGQSGLLCEGEVVEAGLDEAD